MKIAVFHNLPSGGAKRALHGNVSFLAKEHEVDVFVPSTADESYLPLKGIVNDIKTFPVKNSALGFLLSTIKYFPSRVSLIELEKVQKQMAEVVNAGDYDVVLCEQDRHTMAPFFLKYVKKPHVYYCQQPIIFRNEISRNLYKNAGLRYKNMAENLRFKFYGNRMLNNDRKIAKLSKYMVTNSYFSRESILQIYGIKAYVSYLGVDTNLFKPMKVPKDNFVLSVGQCLPEKGFEFILNSLAKIDVNVRPEFVIVSDRGNVHWENYLKDLAIKSDVKLKILNLIEDEELVLLYNKAKLVVYAPYLEPFGLVPLEAMSCGTPVVAVKDGGFTESIINYETGIFTERDETVFAKEISELIQDNDESKKMAGNSIKTANNFWTLKKAGERLFTHLNRALEFYDD
jgi:glycosyltransferase involved in cell wall biosynthesis